jgi:hypothetical protein
MTSKNFFSNTLLFSLLVTTATRAGFLYGTRPSNAASDQTTSSVPSTRHDETDISGTWSGTFFSKHSNFVPFTMTVTIKADAPGHYIGTATLNSDCLKEAHLEVRVSGSGVVLAGSDEAGDNITVRGTIDNSAKLLKASYILHASASGRCETDQGTGTLSRR